MSGKVTGIGGIFFKVDDPGKTRNWYKNHLGLVTNEYGSLFRTFNKEKSSEYCQWSPFASNTKYFEPSNKKLMINFRVDNLELLRQTLLQNGVTVLDTIETYEYGKFLHIMDNENNKIELWEPVDNVFTRLYSGQTTDNICITGLAFVAENANALKQWYNHNLGIEFTAETSKLPFYTADKKFQLLNFSFNPVSASHLLLTESNKEFIISYTCDDTDSISENLKMVKQGVFEDIDGNIFKLIERE